MNIWAVIGVVVLIAAVALAVYFASRPTGATGGLFGSSTTPRLGQGSAVGAGIGTALGGAGTIAAGIGQAYDGGRDPNTMGGM